MSGGSAGRRVVPGPRQQKRVRMTTVSTRLAPAEVEAVQADAIADSVKPAEVIRRIVRAHYGAKPTLSGGDKTTWSTLGGRLRAAIDDSLGRTGVSELERRLTARGVRGE